jgi:hypothetical protein
VACVVGVVEGVVAAGTDVEVLLVEDVVERDVVGVSRHILIGLPLGDMFVVCGISC